MYMPATSYRRKLTTNLEHQFVNTKVSHGSTYETDYITNMRT